MTHLRVPFGFWIMGDIEGDEPYMSGEFPYLLRLLGWCEESSLSFFLASPMKLELQHTHSCTLWLNHCIMYCSLYSLIV